MATGLLLINLGTPDSPSTPDVRKYLTEFLNDSRVIDIPAVPRFLLVNGIIVPFRSSKSAKLYQHIWTEQGSPLLTHSLALKTKVQEAMGDDYIVELGMRYQQPSLESALDRLRLQKVDKVIIFPLYPHYASSSTGSCIDKAIAILRTWEVIPNMQIISKFYDDPGYLNAMTTVAKKYNLEEYDFFLFSYHGLPERHINKSSAHYGDGSCLQPNCCEKIGPHNAYCYRAACYDTTKRLVKMLKIPEGKYTSSFQSRLDDKWLKPYSDKVVAEKGQEGIKKMLVFSPAFVADCLETIYEIGVEYAEIFHQHGGEKIQLVESLNTHSSWVEAIKQRVLQCAG